MDVEKNEKENRLELQVIAKQPEKKLPELEQESYLNSVTTGSAHEDDANIINDFFQEKSFGCLQRQSIPRIWAIKIMLWPYFETITIFVILCNAVTLGMYDPYDSKCQSKRCRTLEIIETAIFSFFVFEMLVKMLAMGLRGPLGYFKDSWNKLDFFIVIASAVEYLYGSGEYLSSIRAARVLRPLRAINKVPSIRILVALLLDTLPMLGNVLAICTLIFVVFGIIGVQLWQGILRNRCVLQLPQNVTNGNLTSYYCPGKEYSLMCSLPADSGIVQCNQNFIPKYSASRQGLTCSESYHSFYQSNKTLSNTSCINWNMYYSVCKQVGNNPYYGAISFDHAGLAFVAIFQVITLEGWSQIMYFLQDTYSPWVWIYFVALIVVGAYFMTNLCLVVIAAQFSETRQRESALIEQANKRARLLKSYSTLSGSIAGEQDQGCYTALLGMLVAQLKRFRKLLRKRFAGTRCCKAEDKKVKKKKRKPIKRKSKQSVTSTIHLHHHHHHHFHHHHHICPNEHSCTCADYSPDVLRATEQAVPAPTILAIEQVDSEPRPGIASVGPLAIQSTALLMPDTTVVICRSRPTSAKSLQPTHTVSFISTSLSDQGSFSDESLRRPSASSHDFATKKKRSTSTSCPKEQQYEAGVRSEKYEQYYEGEPSEEEYEDEEDDEEEDDEEGCCFKLRHKLMILCESDSFKIFIMASILLNTLTMAIEHHGQPEKLTDALEILNYIFTGIFFIEFVLKIVGYGFYGYIKDSFNLFDGTIVIISTVEIFGESGSGVSVLRTFRLMRIFKLIRFLPSLQKQVTVMVKTLDSVMTFLGLLIIFIFTVSILGMHLFGAKIIINGVPVRHNFDSLLWALMTTFQVLTQEDWNTVMYDAMRTTSKWASLYFIILMTLGNYILFNLLVAILVEGFSNDPKLRDLIKPKSKQQIVEKGSDGDLILKEKPNDENDNKRSGNANHEKTNLQDGYIKCDGSCHGHRSIVKTTSNLSQSTTKQLISYNSTTKGNSWPNLAIKCQEKSCGFLPEGRVRCDSDTTLKDTSPKKRSEGKPLLERGDDVCALYMDRKEEPEKPAEEKPKKKMFLSIWCDKVLCSCFETRREYSLYLLSPTNSFRKFNMALYSNKWFDRVVLFFITFNCVVLAMESPGLDPNGVQRKFIDITNNIFTGVFILEMIIKVIAMGFVVGPTTYLKSGWNVMDFFLIVISVTDLLVTHFSNTKSSILGVLKVFRALRTLRPLRVISRAPGLKLVVETLMSSLKPIGNLLVIAGVFFTIFGILGVQIFKGKFYYCLDPTGPVTTKAECILRGGSWRNREYNFDNLLKAMLTLFVFSTKDGWVALMYHGIDAVGVNKEPVKNYNPWAFLYFFAFLLIAGFVVINMVVGVIIDNFHRCRIEIEAIDGVQTHIQTKEEHILDETDNGDKQETSSLCDDGNSDISGSLFDTFPLWRRILYTIVTHYKFDIMIATVIGLNVFFMAIEYYNMPYGLTQFLKIMNFIFTGIFVLEAVMKMLAFGVRTFFSERWNQLDMVIVVLSIVGIVLEELNKSLPINPTIIRIMRVLRITRVLKILKSADGIQKLLNCLSEALPQVGNLSMLFLLLFFIFSSLGMELFGKLDCSRDICRGLNRHAHFKTFGHSMLTLFRISTGDSWSGIMRDTLNRKICTQDCDMLYWIAPLYFAFFVLSTQFVLVNVVVAVLMKQLEDSKDESLSSKCESISEMDVNNQGDREDAQSESQWRSYADDENRSCHSEKTEDPPDIKAEFERNDAAFLYEDHDMLRTNLAFSPECIELSDSLTKQETQETTDDCSVALECGIDNAVIVVSPVHNHSDKSDSPPCSPDTASYMNMEHEGSRVTLQEPCNIEASVTGSSRSMPDILRIPIDDNKTIAETTTSLSNLEVTTANRLENTPSSKRPKSDNELTLFTRRKSSSKVAPLPDVLLVQQCDTLQLEDNRREDRLTISSVSNESSTSVASLNRNSVFN